jgi:hypothetical protein
MELSSKRRKDLAEAARGLGGWDRAYPASVLPVGDAFLVAGRSGRSRKLAVCGGKRPKWASALRGTEREDALLVEADHAALETLKEVLPFLRPRAAGKRPSFGFGDRTGLGTPGHLASLGSSGIFPVLAQQSTREMTRTQRTPDEVMDAAVFGALQAGWTEGFGADADHLKTAEEIGRTAKAGFVMFTLDAADYVEDRAGSMSDAELETAWANVVALVPRAKGWEKAYDGKTWTPARGLELRLEGRSFREAAVKYGRAIAHWAELEKAARKATAGGPCEIEVSGDETSTPTSPAEHHFIVRELQEQGCRLDGLAPRFVGDFEKGIDYKGDLRALEASLVEHAALARAMGGYKISVHSGSDKFSIYPAVARATKGAFHLKTAGTSWLEALRAVVRKDPALFREVAAFARERYAADSATYFISGRVADVAPPEGLPEAELERLYLDENAGRQILHVTYGSVLTVRDGDRFRFRERIFDLLAREEDVYAECLEKHLGRHVKGFVVRESTRRRAATGVRR